MKHHFKFLLMTAISHVIFFSAATIIFGDSAALGDPVKLGIFTDQTDVGDVANPGIVEINADGQYTITGGGENIWNTNDAFHFVWQKVSGDLTLSAAIKFLGTGGEPHRKACLMIRQSLSADSAYVDVAVHGNGLTALQCRDTDGDVTHEIQLSVSAPDFVRIEKHGDYVSMSFEKLSAGMIEPFTFHSSGAMYKLRFKEPFYVGFAVCPHDNKTTAQVFFSDVQFQAVSTNAGKPAIETTLETIPVSSTDRTIVYHTHNHFEAANWSRDGKYFFFNGGGRIYKLPIAGGEPQLLDTGTAISCNNDHGLSPDGTQIAVSDSSQGDKQSRIYIVPIEGGPARQITPLGPSYWHGWSPDGKTLAYCAERNGEFDVYTIPVAGGSETRLTTAPGLDDGPDYSPDGKYIYFNSVRTGLMQIWRMKADGSDQEQITFDDYNNWFAHPSPDGQWIVFISYDKDVKGHPANQDVTLRLMNLSDKKISILAKLFGGQGTINVPSWSPDSKTIAFVSYQMAYP
jgi:TolB protein